ncbi:ATP-binding protein [archaeon]|jgi:uncharacterized protein|nr:ATP-binding protein [archaeon]MBT4396899.1 ATP-binding protein [archaeon]MBT4441423.1 ATP-binding protein [archaeon]
MVTFDISQLSEQNPWWADKNKILEDHKLKKLNQLKFKWNPSIKHFIHLDQDVIYTVRGPRQVGKTTLIKLIIKDLLLNKKVDPENIFFWSLERNSDEMNQIIQTYLSWRSKTKKDRKYIFLDEICSVKNWSKELIYFANKGDFENCSIIVTGSHAMDLKHSTELMPGRRGGKDNDPLDKILLPMKFSEFVELLWPDFKKIKFDLGIVKIKDRQKKILDLFEGKIDKDIEKLMIYKKELDSLFEIYLLTGGLPSVINEYQTKKEISTNLFNVYITAVIGSLRKYKYKEEYFKQLIREVFKTLSTPISWKSFTQNTIISSHNTAHDYIEALEDLYTLNKVYRCSVDKKIRPFSKKLYIQDPFIFHALHGWSNGKKDYFTNAKANLLDLEVKSKLVESVVYNHLCRLVFSLNPKDLFDPKDHVCYFETKKKKEIDFVILFDDKVYPFEVKYQSQIRGSDFVGFGSFKGGVLISKNELGLHRNYVKIPISLFLMLV